MRAREFLFEKKLSPFELNKYNGEYLLNLIQLIHDKTPLQVALDAQSNYGKYVLIDPSESERLKNSFFDAENNLINVFPSGAKLKLADSEKKISIASLEKSKDIKGKETDFNMGDIGEIAIGISAAARFYFFGTIDFNDFIDFAQKFQPGVVVGKTGKLLNSRKLEFSGDLNYKKGKKDQLQATIIAPSRSVDAFLNYIDSGGISKKIEHTIKAAIVYVNEIDSIEAGIERVYNDLNRNRIDVVCDGVSDQRGTKADLTMLIDGTKINVLSVKTGPSQLGQVSGHSWIKQKNFFKTVFGIPEKDLDNLGVDWGVNNSSHLAVLSQIYSNFVIPKIQKLVGTNSVQNEKELIKELVNGLTRYSNNFNSELGQIETVDIVKLIVTPNSPGYKLLRIDQRLTDALMKVDLYGEPTRNKLGIEVYGKVDGIDYTLFKIRSYESKSGKVVRTIIEGGPLLDHLASLHPNMGSLPKSSATPVEPAVGSTATNVQSAISQNAKGQLSSVTPLQAVTPPYN